MAATSLKLPEGLKRRIERLAGAANKTPHAFMVDVLSQEADRAELRERFAKDAAKPFRWKPLSTISRPVWQGSLLDAPESAHGARPSNDPSARQSRAAFRLSRGTQSEGCA